MSEKLTLIKYDWLVNITDTNRYGTVFCSLYVFEYQGSQANHSNRRIQNFGLKQPKITWPIQSTNTKFNSDIVQGDLLVLIKLPTRHLRVILAGKGLIF
jgi:hypothetical protein